MLYKCNNCSRVCDDGQQYERPHGPFINCPYCTYVLTPMWLTEPMYRLCELRIMSRVAVDNSIIKGAYYGANALHNFKAITDPPQLPERNVHILDEDVQRYVLRLCDAHGLLPQFMMEYVLFSRK